MRACFIQWAVSGLTMALLAVLVGSALWPDPEPSATDVLNRVLSDPSLEWRLTDARSFDALASVGAPPAHGATHCFRWDAPTAQWLPTAVPADAESTQ